MKQPQEFYTGIIFQLPEARPTTGSVPEGYTSWKSGGWLYIDSYKQDSVTVLHQWSLGACAEEFPTARSCCSIRVSGMRLWSRPKEYLQESCDITGC